MHYCEYIKCLWINICAFICHVLQPSYITWTFWKLRRLALVRVSSVEGITWQNDDVVSQSRFSAKRRRLSVYGNIFSVWVVTLFSERNLLRRIGQIEKFWSREYGLHGSCSISTFSSSLSFQVSLLNLTEFEVYLISSSKIP